LALFFYWLPERHAWIRAHGGDTLAAAFGEGEHDAVAIVATAGPFLVSLICCAFLRAPRAREVIGIGIAAAVWAFAMQTLFVVWLVSHFGSSVALHAPLIVVTGLFVLVANRLIQRHSPGALPA
jgi:hypothetical protein